MSRSKKNLLKRLVVAVLLSAIILGNVKTNTYAMSEDRELRAEYFAMICGNNYEVYGVYPSVCVCQAIVESGLKQMSSHNYWGIGIDYRYASDTSGVFAYLRCINNGYYKNAPFADNPYQQLLAIAKGGYCGPNWSFYYNLCVEVYQDYDCGKYDRYLRQTMSSISR